MKSNLVNPIEPNPRLNKSLVLSRRQISWNSILAKQSQNSLTLDGVELPALSDQWLCVSQQYPADVTQQCSDRRHQLRHSALERKVTSQSRSLTQAQLQQAIGYIHTHLDQDLSLIQLAKVINISPTYFASLFKHATGTSPHQYVIQQRVKRANLLLRTTDLSIADIAFKVGFSSQSHLTQQFKRFTQMTPKQVR